VVCARERERGSEKERRIKTGGERGVRVRERATAGYIIYNILRYVHSTHRFKAGRQVSR
jgi:hypothetical protein